MAPGEFDPVQLQSVLWTVGALRRATPVCAQLGGTRQDLPKKVRPPVYAIVRAGGRQEKVAIGDILEIDKVEAAIGSTVVLPTLLLVDGDTVTTDAAVLSATTVSAQVLAATKGPKIDILKYKNKTGYRKRLGHRQKHTQVKVTGIDTAK